MSVRPLRATCVVGGVAAGLLGFVPAAAQAAPPPCPAGVDVVPAFTATDAQGAANGKRLTATHVIAVTAAFPEDGPISVDPTTLTWTGPRGVPVITARTRNADDVGVSDDNRGFVPAKAGPLAVRVSWSQSDGTRTGECTGSAGTTLAISAARPLRPRAPRSNSLAPMFRTDEYVWFTDVGVTSDRRPVAVRLRSVRGARLPGAGVPFRTFTIALRPTDAGWRGRGRTVFPFVQTFGDFEGAGVGFVNLLVGMRNRPSNPRFGYELQLVQAGRLLGRVRAAGQCTAFGCEFRPFSVRR